MFISKKCLSRRTILRGLGTSLALPLLDSMIPAGTALANTAANPQSRLSCIYIPHGATMAKWTPSTTGKAFELTEILKPLEAHRNQVCVLSNLTHAMVGPTDGEDSGGAKNHGRAAAVFLTGAHPKRADQAYVGTSIDQIAAMKIGQDTPMPSLELSIEPVALNCDEGTSCAYSNTLSWKSPTLPLPMENNPQLVFENLFGDGTTEEQRRERRDLTKSLLDSVTQQVSTLKKQLPVSDQARISDYLDEIREIERRIHQSDEKLSGDLELPETPVGIPRNFEDHLGLLNDLQVIAFRADITRVSTLMMAREISGSRYPASGINESFHVLSHHSNEQANKDRFAILNQYHIKMLASFLDKLAATPDGDGTLLDHSMVLYGSCLSDANQHNFDPLPVILAGGASGNLEGGRHLMYQTQTPMSNLLLSMLYKLGIEQGSIGDSTGLLEV